MDEKAIKKLIRLVEESDIDQLEVSRWGKKIKITRRLAKGNGSAADTVMVHAPQQQAPAVQPAPAQTSPQTVESKPSDADKKYVEIKSPMVGTFYAAPAPDAPPYIKVGDKVSVGQVVCIVEAMKLMNEIESEVSGSIAKIMVENAQPVEFGQVLFLIDPTG